MSGALKLKVGPDADTFLRALGDRHTFQTFDDAGNRRSELSRIVHGTLAEHADTLASLNSRGAGVFVMVNAGDGNGRKVVNVETVRALFVDLDGAPLEPVLASKLPPHCIVESSPERWHAYWRISDCPTSAFRRMQKALATLFKGDATVCDLPRVMRIPGFDHRKRKPFRSHIVELRKGPPYTVADVRVAFGFGFDEIVAIGRQPRMELQRIPEGTRNNELFSRARGFVQKGFEAPGVKSRLQRINAEYCDPPLCASEVDIIAERALGYGSDGFARLPHRLLDSQEWRRLSPPAHDIIVQAFRIHNGSNNGNIALTWPDFKDREGFSNKHTFYGHRNAAVDAGILVRVSEGRRTQSGRKPDLFAINPKWIRESSLGSKIAPCASVEKVHPYIDKQSLGSVASSLSEAQTNNGKAA